VAATAATMTFVNCVLVTCHGHASQCLCLTVLSVPATNSVYMVLMPVDFGDRMLAGRLFYVAGPANEKAYYIIIITLNRHTENWYVVCGPWTVKSLREHQNIELVYHIHNNWRTVNQLCQIMLRATIELGITVFHNK